ncbi:tRNA (N6-threonylcarbamoyladenosine(37)-N6)-methyltransferase TrmO [Tenacibaculum singaporense]|uniref:tRNA (N6-threonylcarbamoyladenosine(37)-N6)-methyltransferase TrmO n=1 Tax=Tenacibaculum singaporense TaxID=2358479 RepID=UPI000F66B6F7|nr:tRNA (N6-threonylcarbamoyladenosine(37)-N6)-methyltransferase TrmO [Tenacibaculum singaporense]RSC93494.1 tRNA (N6-threonylcarbamoyladenosine(37)-N6)-methyltransferase TrmO [Tenacibaculum singaporense]
MKQNIKYIGMVHSSLKSIEECPLQESENAPKATIEVFPEFQEATKDLKVGDQILLFTWLHKADREILSCKPRNDESAALTGIFSTRSPDRPNPIGIHSTKILSISNNGTIEVSRLEVIDNTPIIDIKPIL